MAREIGKRLKKKLKAKADLRREAFAVHKRLALTMIAMGATSQQVSDHLGLSVQSVRKWRRQPLFQKKLDSILNDVEQDARRQLRGLTGASVEVLQNYVRQGRKSRATSRDSLRAAMAVLERVFDKEPYSSSAAFDEEADEAFL